MGKGVARELSRARGSPTCFCVRSCETCDSNFDGPPSCPLYLAWTVLAIRHRCISVELCILCPVTCTLHCLFTWLRPVSGALRRLLNRPNQTANTRQTPPQPRKRWRTQEPLDKFQETNMRLCGHTHGTRQCSSYGDEKFVQNISNELRIWNSSSCPKHRVGRHRPRKFQRGTATHSNTWAGTTCSFDLPWSGGKLNTLEWAFVASLISPTCRVFQFFVVKKGVNRIASDRVQLVYITLRLGLDSTQDEQNRR